MATLSTLTPAYGRDYKTKAEVVSAWNADKDFLLHMGLEVRPINRPDIGVFGECYDQITVRFAKQRKVTVLVRGKDGYWK